MDLRKPIQIKLKEPVDRKIRSRTIRVDVRFKKPNRSIVPTLVTYNSQTRV